jgi:hypothetical protein
MEKVQRKLHNPKSHAPAVYIPCWLIQVPSSLLSYAAKILYGRLSQWSTTKCTVHRSIWQLSKETGMSPRSVQRIIKELKETGLIGAYQAETGGVNHYLFYDHPWMHEPINEHLVYHESYPQPPTSDLVPPPKLDVTPTSDLVPPPTKSGVPKIEEIKVNNNKSFCASAQKKPNSNDNSKSKSAWQEENAKKHDFAQVMDITAQSKEQMDRETKHIEENNSAKRTRMPDALRAIVQNMKRAH